MTSAIHPSAFIEPGAEIGANVTVGPYSVIHSNVKIHDHVQIGAYCELGIPTSLSDGSPLVIGAESLVRSHSVFYEGSQFGERLVTGHRVTVRERCVAGKNLQVGTLSDIQGHCEIGDYVRMHSNVHIGHKSKVGNFVWIFPYVVLTNDPHPPSETLFGVTVCDYVALATMTVILPGVTINEGALVGAHSSVSRDVEADTVVVGSPAKTICPTEKIQLRDGSEKPAYPWRRHFHRGYPDEVIQRWLKEFEKFQPDVARGNEH